MAERARREQNLTLVVPPPHTPTTPLLSAPKMAYLRADSTAKSLAARLGLDSLEHRELAPIAVMLNSEHFSLKGLEDELLLSRLGLDSLEHREPAPIAVMLNSEHLSLKGV